ncbi:MAG TPA: hypothetical protein VF979_03700 [Streptosporangiaceae bacterium]
MRTSLLRLVLAATAVAAFGLVALPSISAAQTTSEGPHTTGGHAASHGWQTEAIFRCSEGILDRYTP